MLDLCAGDLGASAARTWDIEAYAPGCDLWLEVSSVSWFADYQARRAGIRYRPTEGKGNEVCHTVNGSAMGWPRTVAAYLETHRQPDGSIAIVAVPPALPRRRHRHPRRLNAHEPATDPRAGSGADPRSVRLGWG